MATSHCLNTCSGRVSCIMKRRAIGLSVGIMAGVTGAYWSPRTPKSKEMLPPAETKEGNDLFKFGKPESPVSLHTYKSHSLNYDRLKKIPLWVIENLSKDDNKKDQVADRVHSSFQPDPNLPAQFSATNSDYLESGWSRGHMAAAGNYKHSQESMDDTFYLTNILPQDLDNNCNYWYRLERYCRKLSQNYDTVTVISGPLFVPVEKDGKKVMQYEVIGGSGVHVPTHLFKIVLAEKENEPPLLGSFVIPNEPIPDQPLTNFQVPLEDIEKSSGTQFLERLQRQKIRDLCEVDGCQMISQKKVDLYRYTQKIWRAESKDEAESIWAELHSKGYVPDELLSKAYNDKINEFKE